VIELRSWLQSREKINLPPFFFAAGEDRETDRVCETHMMAVQQADPPDRGEIRLPVSLSIVQN